MSGDSATIGYLNQQIDLLKKRLNSLGHRLDSFDSIVLDEAAHREQLSVVVVRQVAELTQELKMKRLREEHQGPSWEQISIHRDQKRIRNKERVKFIESIKQLASYNRRTLKSACECGEHVTLAFYDGRNKVTEMCPMKWWRLSSNLANFTGNLSNFLEEFPWEETNQAYLLEK